MTLGSLAPLVLLALAPTGAAEEGPALGKPPAFEALPVADRLGVPAGSRLHAAPDAASATLAILDVTTELEVVERAGAWVRVRWGGRLGWYAPPGTPPGPPQAVRPRAPAGFTTVPAEAPPAGPDPAGSRLAAALTQLGTNEPAGRLGPFPLYTDDLDGHRLRRLVRVGDQLPATYEGRYGVAPAAPSGAVVLFSKQSDYEEFAGRTVELADLAARGHAFYGIAALYAGRDVTEHVLVVLVHELAHLLNRAAFGRPLPTWLEEGLANDLAWSRIDRDGRLEVGTWGGFASLTRNPRDGGLLLELRGAQASRRTLLEAWRQRELPSLPELLEMPWAEFVEPERRPLHYAQSTTLVRFLLDGLEPRRAAGFRGFLAAVASGAEPGAGALAVHLGEPLADVERDFEAWLTLQVALGR
jgi:hypothetical protein